MAMKQQNVTTNPPPRVVIVGAGFGGLKVARQLARVPVHVVLVDRRNYHLFQPLLYQVATAGLGPTDIASSLRSIVRRQRNVDIRMADVTGVDLAGRRVATSTGDIPYDYLVVAAGGQTNYFNVPGLSQFAIGLKDLDDAVRLRNHALLMFELAIQESDLERRKALLTFAVVGGGPTGVEYAGALSELIRLVLIKDYPRLNIKDVRILLLEATHHLLSAFPDVLQDTAARILWRKHIEVRFGAAVASFDGRCVALKSGELIPAHTLIWAAGVRAVDLVGTLGVAQDRAGRILTEPTLQVPGHPDVFAIGDCASPQIPGGPPLPMTAPVAIQQGICAAANIHAAVRGQPPRPFVYKDKGALATIGRNAAVACFGKLRLSGFPAWVLWLVVHIVFLIGFRNRLMVMINWAWDYFFFDRAVRMITHDGRCPGCPQPGDGRPDGG